MGESKFEPLRLCFESSLRLEFHGANVTSDAGLLAYRKLDETMGLTRGQATTRGTASRRSCARRCIDGWRATKTRMMRSDCASILPCDNGPVEAHQV